MKMHTYVCTYRGHQRCTQIKILSVKGHEKKPIVLAQLTTRRSTDLMPHLKAMASHGCDEHNS